MSFLAELIRLLRTEDGAGPGLKLECPTHGDVRILTAWLEEENDGVRLKGYCPRCPRIARSGVIKIG